MKKIRRRKKMNVSDMIRKLEEMNPEAEVKFFTLEQGFFGEWERTQIFVEDISKGDNCLEIVLG
jgi:hypothetical protein